jgi:hypothetical protein
MDELKERMVEGLKGSIRVQGELMGNRVSHIVVVSGHGGNNFLVGEEGSISKELGLPFRYIPPFQGIKSIRSKKHGKIQLTHADDGEHSVGLYLGLLDKRELRRINAVAKKDPAEALRQNPAIMGLGYYVLPDLSGEKYKDLRERHKELFDRAMRFVAHDRRIIADYDVGRQLVEKNIQIAVRNIKELLR